MAISDYSATAANNTAISGITIAEGCPPSSINNAIRQQMADLANASFGTNALTVQDASFYITDNTDTSKVVKFEAGSLTTGNTRTLTAPDNSGTLALLSDLASYATTASLAAYAPLASPALTGTPTAPTASNTTRTTQLATTAFANPAATLALPGAAGLPAGLLFKWGQVTAGAASAVAVTYAAAFPTNTLVVLASLYGFVSAATPTYACGTGQATATGFNFYNTHTGGVSAVWLALGY